MKAKRWWNIDLTPVVHSFDQIRRLDQLASASGQPLGYHLKIDSGMGRLGTRAGAEEIAGGAEGRRGTRSSKG